jgi:hypothetical protein
MASYKIIDETKVIGGLERYQRNILIWYRDNRVLLIEI